MTADSANKTAGQICFVCTANICRSPFAEAYARKRLAEVGMPEIQVISTGVSAMNGNPATPQLIALAHEFEVDLKSHRSRKMSGELLAGCRFILGMEPFHVQEIGLQFPATAGRVYLLRNFALSGSRTRGITDPFGLTDDFIRACFDDIAEAVDGFIEHLRKG